MIRVAAVAVGCVLFVPVLVLGAASGGAGITAPSLSAISDIPPDYLALYQQAGAASGVPWPLLAGIGKVECDHGKSADPACWQHGATNSAGAGGPMQFLASTWASYGVDANGDGTANRWDAADAIDAAANLLHANGAPADSADAVFAYNHSWAYVHQVLGWASLYAQPDEAQPAGSPAEAVVAYALAQLGTPYRWGGAEPGGFDCSGLVQAAYAAAGIQLPRTAQAQYDATTPVPAGQPIEPGDLVFFGSDLAHVDHVGLVVASGVMVDAPHSGAVVRTESYAWSDYLGASMPGN